MYEIDFSNNFKKDFKRIIKRGYLIIRLIATGTHSDLF
jgi:mRNA-degrading endonuclease YafQ of YafQ-DinJ toxin-antitoxin module